MANIATIEGNIIADSNVELVQSPSPILPTITTGNNEPTILSYGFTNVYYQTYNSLVAHYPHVNKSFPDQTEWPIKIYSLTSINLTPSVGAASFLSINNIEAFHATSAQTITLGANISQIAFPHLKYIFGQVTFTGGFIIAPIYPVIQLPELIFASAIIFNNAGYSVEINLPKAQVVGLLQSTASGNIRVLLPEMLQMGYTESVQSSVEAYSFPKLKVLSSFNVTGTKNSLTTIDLPELVYAATMGMPTLSPALTTFNFGSTLKGYGTSTSNFVTTSNSLNQASVDNILIRFAALDGTNGTTLFANRTVTITGGAATPSAAGLAAKATLQARGCTVTTN